MKNFRHVNILKIEAFVTGQQPYIIMESVLHASLLNCFEKNDECMMDVSYLVNVSAQAVCGMAYLETQKCIHRNLTAKNVMLTETGAKITNFSQA